MTGLPAIEPNCFDDAIASKLLDSAETMPRILILYGSVRERTYSRCQREIARDPANLSIPDRASAIDNDRMS